MYCERFYSSQSVIKFSVSVRPFREVKQISKCCRLKKIKRIISLDIDTFLYVVFKNIYIILWISFAARFSFFLFNCIFSVSKSYSGKICRYSHAFIEYSCSLHNKFRHDPPSTGLNQKIIFNRLRRCVTIYSVSIVDVFISLWPTNVIISFKILVSLPMVYLGGGAKEIYPPPLAFFLKF